MKKIIIFIGTRPEAIKMLPLYLELKKTNKVYLCNTGQHSQMIDQVLDYFDITPDFNLGVMKTSQTLTELTSTLMRKTDELLRQVKPQLVLVHGDTTTSMISSLSSFYNKIDVAHIEAGLRTNNIYSPWPEEINRQINSRIAKLHFAPTELSKKNLEKENINSKSIYVVGNTGIDALMYTIKELKKEKYRYMYEKYKNIVQYKKLVLVTGHRRENFDGGLERICEAVDKISRIKNIQIIFPVHLNPEVQKTVNEKLNNNENITLVKPMEYLEFVYCMSISSLIISDSGGIQEEAPILNVPVLVTRESTERPEVLDTNLVKLVGNDVMKIYNLAQHYLDINHKLECQYFPFGNGDASIKIAKIINE
jgi:UDP-N-acetylglucosamine 2-epimerase (non-hydrolysing)